MIRAAAYEVLRYGGALASRETDAIAARYELEGRDLALLRGIVRTAIRRLGTLRALVSTVANSKPNPDVATFIHIGLVQLLFLDRIPEHAAVGETVQAANDALGPPKGRFVNACLRETLRRLRAGTSGDPRRDLVGRNWHFEAPVFRDPDQHYLLWAEDALSLPAQLMRGWVQRLGRPEAERLARLALQDPPLSVRVRGDQGEALLLELEAIEPALRPYSTRGPIWLFPPEERAALVRSEAFVHGRITVQGESAFRAAALLEPRPDEVLLDLCAAPGGKTAVLAEAGARVHAGDVDEGKLSRLRETLGRLDLLGRVECTVSDGAAAFQGQSFDGVLVDAPCSNTGVLAGRPEARWRFGPQSNQSLHQLQQRLFEEAAERVRPGGRLVWSTCSIEPSENAAPVRAFLAGHPDWALEERIESRPDFDEGPVDGGFAARLRHKP